jgi:hypothetical protein
MQPNNPRNDPGAGRTWDSSRSIPAIILIGIGCLFLLSNLHLVPSMNWFDFWPMILIVIGAIKLADSRGHDYTAGLILFGIGAIFLAGNLHVLPFAVWDLWPLILIWVGITLLLQRSRWPGFGDFGRWHNWARFDGGPAGVTAGDLNLAAVFSGGKRRIVSDDFRGGIISAVFGGFELDLRKCQMQADSATIKIDAVFGGVEMKIPENWYADVQGVGIFGGYSDETVHPPIGPGTKRLVLKGGAVFGGVVVKN